VVVDPAENLIRIEGSSYPSHPEAFCQPIMDHVQQWTDIGFDTITIDFALHYVNTSSSKYLLKLLQIIDRAYTQGKDFTLNWHYLEYDTDIKEQGEMIFTKLQMNRNLVLVQEENVSEKS